MLLLVINSCKKELIDNQDASSINWARDYYNTSLNVIKPNSISSDPSQQTGSTTGSTTGSKYESKPTPLWQLATNGENNGFSFVEVPLVYTSKMSSIIIAPGQNPTDEEKKEIANASFDILLIYRNNEGAIKEQVVSLIPDLAYLKKHSNLKQNKLAKLDTTFSGYLAYNSWKGEKMFLERIENGLLVKTNGLGQRIMDRTAKPIKSSKETLMRATMGGDENCTTITYSNYWVECQQFFSEWYCTIDYTGGYSVTYCSGGDGGNEITTVLPTVYVCDCDCPEEDSEMVDANTSYEPKWGQLGNLSSIKNEVNKRINQTSNFNSLTLADKLLNIKGHFNANRNYKRDPNGELIDAPDSKLIDRYIYTETNGWIDMHHFFYAAFLSETNSAAYAFTITTGAEYIQSQLEKQQNSAYSYEDLPSNYAGIKFWQQYGQNLKNETISFDNALTSYFNSVKAKEPSDAPNYDYIPHIIDNLAPKNRTSKGLVGDVLKNAAKESFCKKTAQVQNNIKEAHKKLNPSSH